MSNYQFINKFIHKSDTLINDTNYKTRITITIVLLSGNIFHYSSYIIIIQQLYIIIYVYIYIYIYIYYITRILLLFHERDPSTALSFSNKSILSHISNFLDCKFSDHKITSVSPAEANTSEEDVLLSLIIQQNVRMSLFRIPAHKFTIQLVKG